MKQTGLQELRSKMILNIASRNGLTVLSRVLALPKPNHKSIFLIAAIILLQALPSFAVSRPELCEIAARKASAQSGVPLNVLRAVMLTETGRKRDGQMQPWPWTVNFEGQGVWFETADDARGWAYQLLKKEQNSFDVGCFQVNYKWHGENFPSLEAMMNPNENAAYAAKFLSQLYEEKGRWDAAVGAYHSRNPELSKKYLAKYTRYRKAMPDNEPSQESTSLQVADTSRAEMDNRAPRLNTFPLLIEREVAPTLGSLVPVGPTEQNASLFQPAAGL